MTAYVEDTVRFSLVGCITTNSKSFEGYVY